PARPHRQLDLTKGNAMTDLTPTPEDKFSFGLWTVQYPGRDPFGDPTRAPMDPVRAVEKLAEIGAYGINFHDDDVVPFGTDDAERDRILDGLRKSLADTGLVVTTATTNLFSHPVFKDGGFTSNNREVRRFALKKVMRNIDLAAELGAKVYVAWGGREGAESGAAKDVMVALDRYREAFNLLGEFVTDRGYDIKFAIEPKPNEPRGDILLPTVGHAMAFISTLDRPELVGVNPEIGHEEMAGLNAAAGYAQALWQGKLFHIDLNGQNGPRYDQDLRFGAGNVRGAFWVVDTLLAGGYDGPVHFDFKTPRTEDDNGVWVAAEACMTNYLILREKALAFRADPEVQGALADAQLPDLARPTLAEGESWSDIEAAEVPDIETIGAQGMAFERLDQLALEHLYGVRS
ncbi:MAG: xylose isomerase, partial [Marmoricola sp.]|nr:xylose isomerase [Marmoricola sp.]